MPKKPKHTVTVKLTADDFDLLSRVARICQTSLTAYIAELVSARAATFRASREMFSKSPAPLIKALAHESVQEPFVGVINYYK